MYNATIDFIRNYYVIHGVYIINFIKLRGLLKNIKTDIIKKSYFTRKNGKFEEEDLNNSKFIIKTHMMDQAIKTVRSNLKSMISNKRAGNIRHFRLRYL